MMLTSTQSQGERTGRAVSLDVSEQPVQNRTTSAALDLLLKEYATRPRPIHVSFRQLVGPIPVNDLTHSIYPYPARLLRQIPRFFLRCEQIARPGALVLDPFCGSGTVLVEARAARVDAWGIDSNPFARLLSQVKTVPLPADMAFAMATDVLARAKSRRSGFTPDVVNIDLWFSGPARKALERIRRSIDEASLEPDYQRFLLVVLARTADRCSLRDPRIPVPVRRRDWAKVAAKQKASEVFATFSMIAAEVAKRLGTIPTHAGVTSVIDGDDAAKAGTVFDDRLASLLPRPQAVITSPPYGAGQKYIRSSSLALGWTGLAGSGELANLEKKLIGREHLRHEDLTWLDSPNDGIKRQIADVATKDRFRAAIYAHYFNAMNEVMKELSSLLSPRGYLVLVAGSNTVAGRVLETNNCLKDLAVDHGLVPVLELRDDLRGRVLLTKRATAGRPLPYETIHLLQKA